MTRDGRLGHSYRAGVLVFPGLASDHAAMANAALALHQATGHETYLADARHWVAVADRHYRDPDNGWYFAAAEDAEALIVRMKAASDEATPSETLVRLWILTGDETYRASVDQLFAGLSGDVVRNLFATGSLLAAFDTRLQPIQVIVVAPPGTDPEPILTEIAAATDPRIILTRVTDATPLPAGHPAAGKPAVNGEVTVYICRGETCSLPVTGRIHVKQALHH